MDTISNPFDRPAHSAVAPATEEIDCPNEQVHDAPQAIEVDHEAEGRAARRQRTLAALTFLATARPDEQVDDVPEFIEVDHTTQRRAAQRRRTLTALAFLATALSCLALGGFLARQRYKAQKVIASVNGRIITEDEFLHRMEIVSGSQTLHRITNEILQDQYAKKRGVTVSQAELDARYQQISSMPDFPAYLADTHQSGLDVLNQLRMEMILNKIVALQVKPSEADVATYYRVMTDPTNPDARFYTPPRVTIAVITTGSHTNILKAKQALDQGARFEDLVATYSQDKVGKKNGGVLAPITRGRTAYSKAPGMEALLFGMKVGEVAGPVASGKRWTLIHCLRQEPEVIQPREQVDYECRVGAMMARLPKDMADKIHADYMAFRQSAAIHAFRPEYTKTFSGR
jgi:parvulin-like peptidyl-prolyl isomerase